MFCLPQKKKNGVKALLLKLQSIIKGISKLIGQLLFQILSLMFIMPSGETDKPFDLTQKCHYT